MQVYAALPILTAQPSLEEKQDIPHQLYGLLHPDEKSSAGLWRAMAITAIEDALAQGKTPIIVGGSGLYIKALTEGFSPMPDVPDDIRIQATALCEELGAEKFHTMLQQRDPVMAARFHPNHSARLIRAYEILETTGQSLSVLQDMPKEEPPAHWHFDITLVMPEKKTLDARCDARFDWMMANGAIEEVREFSKRDDVSADALIRKALGLFPLAQWLEGSLSKDASIERAKIDTRQYAKRQLTWFRHQISENENCSITRLE